MTVNFMDPVLTVLPFPISLPPAGSRTLLRGLHEQLRTAILDGRLQPGLQLPATRALADACGVSRNTAVAAYDLLLSEGYLVTRRDREPTSPTCFHSRASARDRPPIVRRTAG